MKEGQGIGGFVREEGRGPPRCNVSKYITLTSSRPFYLWSVLAIQKGSEVGGIIVVFFSEDRGRCFYVRVIALRSRVSTHCRGDGGVCLALHSVSRNSLV